MKSKAFTTITIIIILIIFALSTTPVHATVEGIDASNYDTYVKPFPDVYGYNIGECEREYLPGEEYFYNEYYDHWNVDRVYDETLIPKIIKTDKPKTKKVPKKNKKKRLDKKNKKKNAK